MKSLLEQRIHLVGQGHCTAKEISDHVTQGLVGIAIIALQRGTDDNKNIVDLASQDGKVAAGTSRNVESIREPQAPVSSEEKVA